MKTPAPPQKTAKPPTMPPSISPAAKAAPGIKKSEFAKDHLLDDVAIVSDVLSTQKGLIKMYGTALTEGSNEKMRHLCNTHLTELAADQFDSFLYMSQRNLYPTDPAPAPKLSEAKQRYKATAVKIKQ